MSLIQKIDRDIITHDKDKLWQILSDAWLNIVVNEQTLFNPLKYLPEYLIETPHLYYTWLMMQPEYFSFICKEFFNIQILPLQAVILRELWHRKFPLFIATRGAGKSFLLAVYSLLRILFLPQRKVVICGSAFRQSKVVFEYAENILNNSSLLRDCLKHNGRNGVRHENDMYRLQIEDSVIMAIPIGDGAKIRGLRGNDILADEFAAQSREVFENVIAGFGVVSSTPAENVRRLAAINMSQRLGIQINNDVKNYTIDNQIILSGTAYYDFNHFAEYWKRWKKIVESGGNSNKLCDLFEDGVIPANFKWNDYSIIRIPVELIPLGFMDDAQIARAKATIHSGIYAMEYGAVFSNDSTGFFKRSLIETCVVKNDNIIQIDGEVIDFTGCLVGKQERKYIFGIDPASEIDNFSIVILEVWPSHRRIVYAWTTTRQRHREILKSGLTTEKDFYSYCARKIRDLMAVFPCEQIAVDSQGGGIAIIEALHDDDKINFEQHEQPLWPIIDPQRVSDTDGEQGLHILEPINFAKYEWVRDANNGLRKDMEDKVILFPRFDGVELALAAADDELHGRKFDTYEDCMLEIEELKNELSTIIVENTTLSGRERWVTPEIKLPGNKKGRLRKDRYSALLMANMTARSLARTRLFNFYGGEGGFAGFSKIDKQNKDFHGPAWFTVKADGLYD